MSLKDLLFARNRDEVFARMTTALQREEFRGFPITDWISGGVTLTISQISAEAIADTERTVEAIGYGGYLQTAQGDWLDEIANSQYGLTRQNSTYARGTVTFTAAAGSGGTIIPGGTLLQSTSGQQYATLLDVELTVNGSAAVEVQAMTAGAAANVAPGAITIMLTPLPGVSVSNPGPWLTAAGAERETDEALRTRARLQWPSLGGGMTRTAYEYQALNASPAVEQALVIDQHPRGQGTVDVILWGAGGIGAEDVAIVNAVLQDRRPVTADVLVYAAAEQVIAINLELYAPLLSSAERRLAETQIITGLEQLARETRIGGTLYAAQIIEVAMAPAGMLNAVRLDSGKDLQLGYAEGLTLLPVLYWRER